MAQLETLRKIDVKLELLNYSVEDIIRDFQKALASVDVELRNWGDTMSTVRRIATRGVRAVARVYAREAGETFKYIGLMRYLLVEAVRRWLQFELDLFDDRMMWVKILVRFRDLEKSSMKDTELAFDNLWQPFEFEKMKNLVVKMDKITDEGFGTSWVDNLAATEIEQVPWVGHELRILWCSEVFDPEPLLTDDRIMKFKRRRLMK